MGRCFLYGSGGGARSYKVTGSVSAPENPKPGDIWVETDTPVSIASIVSEQVPVPTWGVVEGYVHITAGTFWNKGTFVNFDRRQGYSLFLYPATCVQGISGKWVRKNAYVYNDTGTWVQFSSAWDGTLFYNGNQYADVTGGWTGADSYSPNLTATLMSGTITISTANAVDLGGFSTLKFMGSGNGANSGGAYSAKCKIVNESGVEVASVDFQSNGTYAVSIAALTGKNYVKFTANGSRGNNLDISKVWLE